MNLGNRGVQAGNGGDDGGDGEANNRGGDNGEKEDQLAEDNSDEKQACGNEDNGDDNIISMPKGPMFVLRKSHRTVLHPF